MKLTILGAWLLASVAFGAPSALLQCDVSPLVPTELGKPMYEVPVKFEQRLIKGIQLELAVNGTNAPRLKQLHIVFDQRDPNSLETNTFFEAIYLNDSLDTGFSVRLLRNYYTSRELSLRWNSTPVLEWNPNGEFKIIQPIGWSVYLEASDPYHEPPLEVAIDCGAAPRD